MSDLQERVEKLITKLAAGWHIGRQDRDDLRALLTENKALREERDKAMRALESLTPSGSEYVNDVERCVAYIKEARTVQHNQIIHQHSLRQQAEAELAQLREQVRWGLFTAKRLIDASGGDLEDEFYENVLRAERLLALPAPPTGAAERERKESK